MNSTTPPKKYGMLHIGKTGGTGVITALSSHLECGDGPDLIWFRHKTGLQAVLDDNLAELIIFFIREPVARFISAFNSRLRKGYPKHTTEWSPREKQAFERFRTPNELAEALGSPEEPTRAMAERAMKAIRHCRHAYEHYLGSVELLERHKDRICFIGAQETLDSDFKVLCGLLKISEELQLPTDEVAAHRTPAGFEKTISKLGRENIERYYRNDLAIYNWCAERRVELMKDHSA